MELRYVSALLKTCTQCQRTLPATSQFWHKHGITTDGWRSKCKICNGSKYTTILEVGQKQCSKCRVVLPKSDHYFARNKYRNDGFSYACKVCKSGGCYGDPEVNKKRALARVHARQKANAKKRDRREILAAQKIYGMKDRSKKEGVDFDFTFMDWEYAKSYFSHSCAVCGQSQFPKNGDTVLAPDHWIPLVKGGASIPSNIIPLCHGIGGCNNSKRDYDSVEWLTGRYYEKDANEILARVGAYFAHIRELTNTSAA